MCGGGPAAAAGVAISQRAYAPPVFWDAALNVYLSRRTEAIFPSPGPSKIISAMVIDISPSHAMPYTVCSLCVPSTEFILSGVEGLRTCLCGQIPNPNLISLCDLCALCGQLFSSIVAL